MSTTANQTSTLESLLMAPKTGVSQLVARSSSITYANKLSDDGNPWVDPFLGRMDCGVRVTNFLYCTVVHASNARY